MATIKFTEVTCITVLGTYKELYAIRKLLLDQGLIFDPTDIRLPAKSENGEIKEMGIICPTEIFKEIVSDLLKNEIGLPLN